LAHVFRVAPVGQREFQLDRMLVQPFRDDDRTYPLGRREPVA